MPAIIMAGSEASLDERPASLEDVNAHLEGFVRAFVDPDRSERWRAFLFDKPEKAARELHKIRLDERRTTWLEGAERDAAYETVIAGRPGIYFTFTAEPVWKSVKDAAITSDWESEDAIFSVIPGKLAIYFNHDHATALLRHD